MIYAKPGLARTFIGMDEYLVRCPACETDQWADVMVLSNYWYYFFIPIFPTGKEANVICKKCGLKRYGAAFSSDLIREYEVVKKFYRHPWFTYIGISILTFPFVILLSIRLIEVLSPSSQ